MRFWDTSAIIPLCVREPATPTARALAEADTSLVAWWATRTECVSAICRHRRDRQLGAQAEQQARRALASLAAAQRAAVVGAGSRH